jgi:hypothetical protein
MKRNHDIWAGAVILVCTAVYFSQTFGIRKIAILPVSSAFIPRICVGFMSVLACALIVQGVRREKKSPAPAPTQEQQVQSRQQLKAAGTALAILFVSILMMRPLGFILSMTFYLLASFLTLSPREKWNIPLFVGISVISVTAIYFTFVKGFNLLLPAGILG